MKSFNVSLIQFGFVACLFLNMTACREKTFHEGKIYAGNVYASPEKLNMGKTVYTEYCMPCHGVNGDGKGVSSKGMEVPPRDFTKGVFKFGRIASGTLPHDEDLMKIIREGLTGTAMLPWDLSHDQLDALVQYIKTFAPATWEGKDKTLGELIKPSADPYGLAHQSNAIEKGKEVYHFAGQCQTCHRAYVSKDEYNALAKKVGSDPLTTLEDNFYVSKPQDSEYGVKTVPPDFTWHQVRSAKTVEELYVRIAAGIGGTAMPSWKGTIEDADIWAVSYYVKSLMDLKDSEQRKTFMQALSK